MAIFRECKHSFQIVQALFWKSASTLVFFDCTKVRKPCASGRTLFRAAKVQNLAGESGTDFFRRLMSEG